MKIKDIANDLHLSISTVSKALNGAFDVSKETKEEVLAYAKAHGYKFRDERISTKTVRRLCVLYDNIDYMSQSNIIIPVSLAFSKYAREKNFETIHFPISEMNTSYDEFMQENNYVGSFIAGLTYKSPLLSELKVTNYPTVLYDNYVMGEKVASISNENTNTIALLVNNLIKSGHKKIGFIHGDKNSFVSNERFAGYVTGLMINDIIYNPDYLYLGEFNQTSGYEAAKYFIYTDVTAIVCSSDLIAIGLMDGLEALGKKVPDDISVTGYDDLDIAKFHKPSLTTVKQDYDLIGEKAFTLLTSMLMNRSPQRIVVSGSIQSRDSVKKINKI